MASVLETPPKVDRDRKRQARPSKGARPAGGHPTKAERLRWDRVNWGSAGWLVVLHVGAITAPFVFTWQAFVLTVVLHWITGGLGICLGYHRLLTHTGMQTYRSVRYLFATLGSLAGEGSPLDWVADHRKHHQLSDQPGDPHSPHDGSFWSHMWWVLYSTHDGDREAYLKRYVPDLARDRGMRFIDKMFLPMHIASGLLMLGVGYWAGGWPMAASLVVWGMFVRLTFVLHSTWLVNSASHMFGYRNYETTDDSRNNWLVALVTYGEGWHNNHHAYPRMARHGHKWWEVDLTYMMIRAMRAVGLVWDVVDLDKGKKGAAVRKADAR